MAKFIYDFNNLISDYIGEKNGITRQEINNLSAFFERARTAVFDNATAEHRAVFDILDNVEIDRIEQLACEIRAECDNFVVLGVGGSALGSEAIFEAMRSPGYNFLPRESRGAPRFFVEDSIDPETMNGLLSCIELDETVFCVVSKSGRTTETMTQFLYVRDLCEQRFGDKWSRHFVVLTDDNDNFLHRYAIQENLRTLIIPTKLGGRYSVLSVVGLLPASVLGLNIRAIVSGAKLMLDSCKRENIWQNAPLLSSAINYLNYKKGKSIAVMIPYSETMREFDNWFCQLWGESIGRNTLLSGRTLTGAERIGQTPIQVTGPSVQHSQFQLYLEGPDDKIFTFIGIENFDNDIPLPSKLDDVFGKKVAQGKTFGNLLNVERIASAYALKTFGKPNETILVESVCEETLGKLFMFFILKMLFMGAMLEINPFGQPAVESIKGEVARIVDREIEIASVNSIEI